MKLWIRLRGVLLWAPLACALASTLRVQALWRTDDPFEMFLPLVLWLILVVGWIARFIQSWRRTRKLPRRALVLRLCAALVLGFARTNAAPTALFQMEKPALRRALARPANKDGEVANLSPIGVLRPTYIYKEGTATCFWFWENEDGFLGDVYESGWAYCPGDSGCRRAGFEGSEAPAISLSADENLGGDWYRVSRWLHH